jgi:hypothetical protein
MVTLMWTLVVLLDLGKKTKDGYKYVSIYKLFINNSEHANFKLLKLVKYLSAKPPADQWYSMLTISLPHALTHSVWLYFH